MSQTYRAVIKQAGAWWIGWIEGGQGVKCQERSHEESLETLRITLAEAPGLRPESARRGERRLRRDPIAV